MAMLLPKDNYLLDQVSVSLGLFRRNPAGTIQVAVALIGATTVVVLGDGHINNDSVRGAAYYQNQHHAESKPVSGVDVDFIDIDLDLSGVPSIDELDSANIQASFIKVDVPSIDNLPDVLIRRHDKPASVKTNGFVDIPEDLGLDDFDLPPFTLLDEEAVLGAERAAEIKSEARARLEQGGFLADVPQLDIEIFLREVARSSAQTLERAPYESGRYFGTPIGELKDKKLKHYRMRLGVPQLVNGKWYTLPTVEEMKEKYLSWTYKEYKKSNPDKSAVDWIGHVIHTNEDTKEGFGQFLVAGGADADVLFQDQLGVLDPSGLKALRSHYSNRKISLEKLTEEVIAQRGDREKRELDMPNFMATKVEILRMVGASNDRKYRGKKA